MKKTWYHSLQRVMRPRSLVVGVGNRLRGDDAFGPAVLDALRGHVHWPLLDAGDAPENCTGAVESVEPELVMLLDAAHWGATPGSVGLFSFREIGWCGASTHSACLRLFCHLVAARCGCDVVLLAAQPERTDLGAPMSERVSRSVATVATRLSRLDEMLRAQEPRTAER